MKEMNGWNFGSLASFAAATLEDRASRLRTCRPRAVRQYVFATDCPLEFVENLEWLEGSAIYMLFLKDQSAVEAARNGYSEIHKSKTHKLSRNNGVISECLYVGSKTVGKVSARIKEHCGFKSAKTFALHLRHWQNEPFEVLLKVAYFGDVAADLIHELEDALWDEHKPMFGRKGRR